MTVDYKKMKKEQFRLSKKITVKDEFEDITLIAGCDQTAYNDMIISTIVVCNAKTMTVVEKKHAVVAATIPYVPGFLAYREMPAILEAFSLLENKPQLLFCDGNGILHPFRIGLASHLGLILDIPTIGIAKKKLYGTIVGENILLNDEKRGYMLTTKEFAKPIVVSPGFKISLKSAIKITLDAVRDHKNPEPLHIAHSIGNKIKKKQLGELPNLERFEDKNTENCLEIQSDDNCIRLQN